MNNQNIEAVEAYIYSLKEKDLSKAPLADDVSFEDPLTPKLNGSNAVKEFLEKFLPAIKGVRIESHLTENDYVATLWEADTVFGIIPIFERFHVVDGKIKEIRAYLDPRPITGG